MTIQKGSRQFGAVLALALLTASGITTAAQNQAATQSARPIAKPVNASQGKKVAAAAPAPAAQQDLSQTVTDAVKAGIAEAMAKIAADAKPKDDFPSDQNLFVALNREDCNRFLPKPLETAEIEQAASNLKTAEAKEIEANEDLRQAEKRLADLEKPGASDSNKIAVAKKDVAQQRAAVAQFTQDVMTKDIALKNAFVFRLMTPAEILNTTADVPTRDQRLVGDLARARNDMLQFRDAWTKREYPTFLPWDLFDKEKISEAARAAKEIPEERQQIIECAERLYKAVANVKDTSKTLSARAVQNNQTVDETEALYVDVAHRDVYDRAQLSAFVGPSFNLKPDGGFQTGVETSVLYDGGAASFFNIGRTFTEFRYESQATQGESLAATVTDQFKSSKGIFRLVSGASFNIDDRYSFATSVGLSAVPRENQAFTESLRERYTATLLTRAFVSTGIYARIGAGFAYDKAWRYFDTPADALAGTNQRESYTRVIGNVEFLLPSVGITTVHASGALRLGIDTPLNGNGPSEVRLTALAYLEFAEFFKALNPLYQSGP